MRKLRHALYALPIFALVVVSLIVVDRYVISLTGYALGAAGLCKHKSVHVAGYNGYPQELSFVPDFQTIAHELRNKSSYRIDLRDYQVTVTRKFNDVEYNLILEKRVRDGVSTGLFDLNTYPRYAVKDLTFDSRDGEPCATPNAILDANVYAIIDDLPLTAAQKNELQGHVHSGVILDINFPML